MSVEAGRITRLPYALREACANGHPWTVESTRWRKRNRGGRHGTAPERDCLICKAVSEGNRKRRKRISERSYQ